MEHVKQPTQPSGVQCEHGFRGAYSLTVTNRQVGNKKVLLDSLCISLFSCPTNVSKQWLTKRDSNDFTSKWVCSSLELEEKNAFFFFKTATFIGKYCTAGHWNWFWGPKNGITTTLITVGSAEKAIWQEMQSYYTVTSTALQIQYIFTIYIHSTLTRRFLKSFSWLKQGKAL